MDFTNHLLKPTSHKMFVWKCSIKCVMKVFIWTSSWSKLSWKTPWFLGALADVMISKQKLQIFTSEFEAHWVSNSYGFVPHLNKKLSKLRKTTVLGFFVFCFVLFCFFVLGFFFCFFFVVLLFFLSEHLVTSPLLNNRKSPETEINRLCIRF